MTKLDQKEDARIATNYFTFLKLVSSVQNVQENKQRHDNYLYKQDEYEEIMTEPEIPQKKPYPMQVEAGKEYHVCMCGKSQNQPLCDGSHAGSGLGPRIFKATEAGFIAFCGCKHSKDETGKCDGTHSSL